MTKVILGIGLVGAAVAIGLGVGALFAWAIMSLWNFAVVPTFHAPRVTFWVTWALIVLFGLVTRVIRGGKASK